MSKNNYQLGIAYWIIYLVFICFFFYATTIDEYRNSEKAKGVVVDKLYTIGHKGRGYYYPQIKFVYNNNEYLFGHRLALFPSSYHRGKAVTVIFPKGEPDKAGVYAFLPYWVSLTALFFSFMFALFLFMSVIFIGWYDDFKRSQKNQSQRMHK